MTGFADMIRKTDPAFAAELDALFGSRPRVQIEQMNASANEVEEDADAAMRFVRVVAEGMRQPSEKAMLDFIHNTTKARFRTHEIACMIRHFTKMQRGGAERFVKLLTDLLLEVAAAEPAVAAQP